MTKPTKKAQSYIACNNCGKVVNKKSMSAHLRSKSCQSKKRCFDQDEEIDETMLPPAKRISTMAPNVISRLKY